MNQITKKFVEPVSLNASKNRSGNYPRDSNFGWRMVGHFLKKKIKRTKQIPTGMILGVNRNLSPKFFYLLSKFLLSIVTLEAF